MFISRDEGGAIVGRFLVPQYEDQEWIPDDSAELANSIKLERIASVQSAYESERDRLNRAWLSALISDGAEEVARQAQIVAQMSALDVQLENDILAILMEG